MRDDLHRPAQRGEVQLPYALDLKTDRLVSVALAPKGKAGGLVCPSCKALVTPVKPKENRKHFRHEARCACGGGRETMLHKLGKQVIFDSKWVRIPAAVASVGGTVSEVSKSKIVTLNSINVEAAWNGLKPDVMAKIGDKELAIEILVWHACEEEKVSAFRSERLESIEIDLRGLRSHDVDISDYDLVSKFALDSAPRRWIHNDEVEAETSWILTQQAAIREQERALAEMERASLAAAAAEAEAERASIEAHHAFVDAERAKAQAIKDAVTAREKAAAEARRIETEARVAAEKAERAAEAKAKWEREAVARAAAEAVRKVEEAAERERNAAARAVAEAARKAKETAERIGLVRNKPGQPFEHYCMTCGEWGSFGFDVNILAGKTGRWYCNEHKPQE